MVEEKSKILIIGGTGSIGKHVVDASARLGHRTFALVRENTVSNPAKAQILKNFKNLGVTLVNGDLQDHESLVKAIMEVDVVISTVGAAQVADQTNIIAAIKEAVIFVDDEDMGTYTIKAVDDPRTLNKIVYMRPPGDICSHNEINSTWEEKTGKKLERIYLSEEDVLKKIEESAPPLNFLLALCYAVFVKGDHTSFDIDPSVGVEASELYPEVQYTSVDEYLARFL